jgi:hypothetical protein
LPRVEKLKVPMSLAIAVWKFVLSFKKISEMVMYVKKFLLITILACSAMGQANAAGCLKGAAVGGVGGHFVGSGHAVLGAAGGCIVGHHMASKKAKQDAQAKAQAQQQVQSHQQVQSSSQ